MRALLALLALFLATPATAQLVNPPSSPVYAEGTFTPVLNFGGTPWTDYYQRSARYTRVGRQVTVEITIQINLKGASTGAATITGLPFAANSTVTATGVSDVAASMPGISTGHVITYIAAGSSTISLFVSSNGSTYAVNDTYVANYNSITVNLTYTI